MGIALDLAVRVDFFRIGGACRGLQGLPRRQENEPTT